MGRSGTGPYAKNASASLFAVGAAHLGRPILGPLSPICRGGYQPPGNLLPSREKVPSVCEADEGAIIERFLCRARRPGAPILEVCAGNFAAAAATYFAHGGSSSQSPLDSVSAWRRKLRSFPCSSSSRRTRFAGLRREQRGIGQNAAGDAADGLRLRYAPPRSIGPLSPDPITGVTPWSRREISGAQNLSGCLNSSRPTGAWVCKN